MGQSPWGPPRMIAAMALGTGILPPPAHFSQQHLGHQEYQAGDHDAATPVVGRCMCQRLVGRRNCALVHGCLLWNE